MCSGYSGISCRDDDHTENKKELFQPQSANSALQADVWSSPSWSHLTQFKRKQPNLKALPAHAGPISATGSKSTLGSWTVLALI